MSGVRVRFRVSCVFFVVVKKTFYIFFFFINNNNKNFVHGGELVSGGSVINGLSSLVC